MHWHQWQQHVAAIFIIRSSSPIDWGNFLKWLQTLVSSLRGCFEILHSRCGGIFSGNFCVSVLLLLITVVDISQGQSHFIKIQFFSPKKSGRMKLMPWIFFLYSMKSQKKRIARWCHHHYRYLETSHDVPRKHYERRVFCDIQRDKFACRRNGERRVIRRKAKIIISQGRKS